MSMSRIRDYYQVPAKRGMRILFRGEPATITSADRSSMHLLARRDDGARLRLHPTWEIEYPTGNQA